MLLSIEPSLTGGDTAIEQILSIYKSGKAENYNTDLNVPYMILIHSCHPDSPDDSVFSIFSPTAQFNGPVHRDIKGYKRGSLHQHNYFELMYTLQGNVYQNVEGKRYLYSAGSCSLMNRNTFHTEEFDTDFTNIFLTLSTDFVMRILNYNRPLLFASENNLTDNPVFRFLIDNMDNAHKNYKDFLDFVPLITETDQKKMIHGIFEQMLDTMLNPYMGATFRIQELFYQLITVISDPARYNFTHVTTTASMDSPLFARINQLLKEHNGRISNRELSEYLNYDGTYLGKIVKKITEKSLFDYSMTFTMEAAAKMLSNTDLSVSEITEELHFSNRSHFYKLFQQHYGMTPREYRLMHNGRSCHKQ